VPCDCCTLDYCLRCAACTSLHPPYLPRPPPPLLLATGRPPTHLRDRYLHLSTLPERSRSAARIPSSHRRQPFPPQPKPRTLGLPSLLCRPQPATCTPATLLLVARREPLHALLVTSYAQAAGPAAGPEDDRALDGQAHNAQSKRSTSRLTKLSHTHPPLRNKRCYSTVSEKTLS
jgi:hypothetical protein